MKKTLLFTLLIVGSLLSYATAWSQDTVSTAGVEFTPVTKPAIVKPAASNKNEQMGKKVEDVTNKAAKQTLCAIFLAGLAGGFAALLMPCIFPMLPLTVSYFTKSGDKKGSAAGKAMIYGTSIIAIYVVMGLVVTFIFGANALNSFSTNGVFNFCFFLLIVAFAASFLGAFEITLPSSWVNKMDQNADKGGLTGLFFMAATLALVSFSCTGPIIGTLLVQAATTGALLGPAIGMLGFALALAIPFVLFALFPGWLRSLPKSGGWLNSVKVTLGFLELALSLKFLSNVDLAYHWHWFDRELFLSLWIVIFALMGFYLLGKLKFGHDGDLPVIPVPRLFLSIIILSFTMYMVPGLWGAPLKSISAFLPPQTTQDFDLYTPTLGGGRSATPYDQAALSTGSTALDVKYASLFHAPLGLHAFFDYAEGMDFARKVHKPVMIDFTGHACVNCRKMESAVWPDKRVFPLINNDYVLIQLYVDDKTELQDNQQYVSTFSKQKITTIGEQNSDLQASVFNSNSQPMYVLLDNTGKLMIPASGAEYDAGKYGQFLRDGLEAFKK
ncbi:protein-disulfide reductase DsbD [Mucilaginibacter sp.]|uniref:protein-disulfide reductase DsbD family protein n=1 Tax=Mucilaginibacter sp. TaxID=1882438 RepID=UPI002636BF83|nr:cytochrome c biogenesis protein CcdA [Mucilaginibacter sp.]MDB4925997.1 disulfide bond formation protein DsbD [Mucilaginibacter sp.]